MDGKVPPGWRLVKFSNAADVNPRRPLKQGQVAPFVEMAALPEHSPRIAYSTERAANGGGAKFRNGDTLFARITPCVENEKVGFVDFLAPGQIGFGSTEFIVLGPRDGLSHPRFLYFLARSQRVRSTAIARMTGTSGRQRVPLAVFQDELDVLLPPLAEQRKIAEILSSVDDAIEKTEAVIRQVQVVRRGLMQQLLTRGIPGRHTRFKHNEVGEIPEEWEVVRLGEVAHSVTSGSRFWARYYAERGALFVRSQNIKDGVLDFSDSVFVSPHQDAEARRTRILPGDILISITGEPGHVTVAGESLGEAYVSQHVALVRPRESKLAPYISVFLNGDPGQRQFEKMQYGQTRPGLNLVDIARLWVTLPPDNERETITSTFNSVQAGLTAEMKLASHLHSAKVALMQALLTGEVRVKVKEAR